MADIVGDTIDPLDHFTKPEWREIVRRARASLNVRVDVTCYKVEEFRAIMQASARYDGR